MVSTKLVSVFVYLTGLSLVSGKDYIVRINPGDYSPTAGTGWFSFGISSTGEWTGFSNVDIASSSIVDYTTSFDNDIGNANNADVMKIGWFGPQNWDLDGMIFKNSDGTSGTTVYDGMENNVNCGSYVSTSDGCCVVYGVFSTDAITVYSSDPCHGLMGMPFLNTSQPTQMPSDMPTDKPTLAPSILPSHSNTNQPSNVPTIEPTTMVVANPVTTTVPPVITTLSTTISQTDMGTTTADATENSVTHATTIRATSNEVPTTNTEDGSITDIQMSTTDNDIVIIANDNDDNGNNNNNNNDALTAMADATGMDPIVFILVIAASFSVICGIIVVGYMFWKRKQVKQLYTGKEGNNKIAKIVINEITEGDNNGTSKYDMFNTPTAITTNNMMMPPTLAAKVPSNSSRTIHSLNSLHGMNTDGVTINGKSNSNVFGANGVSGFVTIGASNSKYHNNNSNNFSYVSNHNIMDNNSNNNNNNGNSNPYENDQDWSDSSDGNDSNQNGNNNNDQIVIGKVSSLAGKFDGFVNAMIDSGVTPGNNDNSNNNSQLLEIDNSVCVTSNVSSSKKPLKLGGTSAQEHERNKNNFGQILNDVNAGNGLLMDDILDEMDVEKNGGNGDANNNATPGGPLSYANTCMGCGENENENTGNDDNNGGERDAIVQMGGEADGELVLAIDNNNNNNNNNDDDDDVLQGITPGGM